MKERRKLLIEGIVQGVGLRRRMALAARDLALIGWVRNLPEGHVEAEIQGDSEAIDALEIWLRGSPSLATIRRMTSIPCSLRCEEDSFIIRR
ncbi:MAG TPA: acylphosphatase [Synergistaceae bacterium]|mgnify:CR=1 FL=1|nr:acylphosphatase [Synergistaceae bacterium]